MKILIACIHYPVASGRYIAHAFRKLGHEVKTVGPSTGVDIWGVKVHERYKWEPDEIPQGWKADLTIFAESAFDHFYLMDYDMPIALWGVDNHVRDYAKFKCDALFLAHSWGARMTEPNAHWLPCAYEPKWNHDDAQERYNDVSMIGAMYPERQALVQEFERRGIKIIAGVGAIYEEYNALYNTAKIALVKSACGDLPIRFFENMAQGCCVLSDYLPDAIKLGFEPFKDFWLYNGADDAAYSAKYLIESGEWKRIAMNGREKVKEHTWENRALQLLREMEMSQ